MKAHQPIEGVKAEEDVSVDPARERFLVMYGYASPGENPPEDGREGPDYLMADQRAEDGSSAEDGGSGEAKSGGAPAKSASKADWVDYAVSQGATDDEASDMTKDELVELYGE